MSSSCEHCSMPANPMLIMPMADTDNSNIAVTVTPELEKTDDLLVIIGVVGTVP